MASSVTVQNIHYGKKNCNLEPFHLSDEYIDTFEKFKEMEIYKLIKNDDQIPIENKDKIIIDK